MAMTCRLWSSVFAIVALCAACSSTDGSPSLGDEATVLSVADVVRAPTAYVGQRIQVRGCILQMCRGDDCFLWLGTDERELLEQRPDPLPQIAVVNNRQIEREILGRQAEHKQSHVVVEGGFENLLYPEGVRPRSPFNEPAGNETLIGPLRHARIVEVLGATCPARR